MATKTKKAPARPKAGAGKSRKGVTPKPPTKRKTPPKARAAPKVEKEKVDRVRPQFAVLRQGIIAIRAARGDATSEIAKDLSINRSYVIRLVSFGMKPENATERAVMKQAGIEMAGLQRLGMGFGGKEGFEVTLAGDDGKRGQGGGRPRKDGKPPGSGKAKKAKTAPAAPAKPKKAESAKKKAEPTKPAKKKVVAKRPAPKADDSAESPKPSKAKKAVPPKKSKESKPKKVAKPKPGEIISYATTAPPGIAGAPDIGDVLEKPASAFAS